MSVICLSTWCGVGVVTYLEPGENLSRGSLLLLQDVPGQSSCVWRGSQSHGSAITGRYTEAKTVPLLSTTNHLRSMGVETCAHTITHRVISDSLIFFYVFKMRWRPLMFCFPSHLGATFKGHILLYPFSYLYLHPGLQWSVLSWFLNRFPEKLHI